jgi:hypothetical protein
MDQKKSLFLEDKIKKAGLGIDILWFLVILAGFLFFTSLIPLPPNDFWWHLEIGKYIYNTHSIPTTNMYAWTLPSGQPFIYAAWLAELLFYLLYRMGGLALIIFMRTILIAITICLTASEAHRRTHSWRITSMVIALLCLMITNNLPVRTQMWAWIPFIVTYVLLNRYVEGKSRWYWLLLCPVCMVLWVNVHGSFVLGIIIVGTYFVGESISKIIKQEKALNWNQIGWIGITGVFSTLTVLINPRFTGIIHYTINLLTNPPVQQLIQEWQSPTPQGVANITFFISILIFIISLAYTKYHLRFSEIILLSGFLWLAWSGQRNVVWYGMISTPVLASILKELPIKTPVIKPQRNWLNLLLAIVLFIPAIAAQPWFVGRLPLPDTYWQQVIRDPRADPLLSVHTPIAAVDYLKSHPGGHLFNEMGYGSYLIWALPEQGVFIDPRIELFPYDLWMDYIHINNGINYDELLARYGVDRILLDKKLQPELASMIVNDQQWILEYDDQYSQVWSKVSDLR